MPKYGFKHYRLRSLQSVFEPHRHHDLYDEVLPTPKYREAWGVQAVIHSHSDGSPVRKPKGRGGQTPRGKFPSYKTRRAQPFESLPERRLIHICEANADVVGYWMQPHRLEMRVVGFEKPLIYVPDGLRLMKDGSVQIVEAKAFPIEDPEYLHKLDLAEQVYEERGWSFHIETNQSHFLRNSLFANAKHITDDRDVLLDSADWLQLYQHMDQCGGHSTYGSVIKALAHNVDEPAFIGRGKVHKMIIQRALHLSLEKKAQDHSPLVFLGADNSDKSTKLQRAWWASNVDSESAYLPMGDAA